MFEFDRFAGAMSALWSQGRVIAVFGISSVVVAGCSADVTRFDEPPFGLTEDGTSGSSVRPQAPMTGSGASLSEQSQGYDTGSYRSAPAARDREIRTTALPAVSNGNGGVSPVGYERPTRETPAAYEMRPAPVTERSAETPKKITVARGDTLYGLSRRYDVSINALMRANGLTTTTLRPGQVLVLPGRGNAGSAAARAEPRTRPPVSRQVTAGNAPATWNGTYTVESGDSLYKIARKYRVKTRDLQRYNGIDNPRRVRPGTVLKVPGAGARAQQVRVASRDTRAPAQFNAPATRQTDAGSRSRSNVAVINAKPVASTRAPSVVQSVTVTPEKPDSAGGAKLRWPVRGKIISKFGRRTDGTQNDGINLEVPAGTDVKAAEAGVVAYSGSELRGYGNLVLVRHDNGWVTAYAHNSEVLVKRGDRVSRGQVIAKAGKTGQVDRPQVHFELRRDAKPVDPIPYLQTL